MVFGSGCEYDEMKERRKWVMQVARHVVTHAVNPNSQLIWISGVYV